MKNKKVSTFDIDEASRVKSLKRIKSFKRKKISY